MQSVIQVIFYALTLFLPIVFTTINSELFEFPKFIILISATLLIALAWGVDLYQNKKIPKLQFSPIVIGVILVLATQTFSTIFSINPYTSFWGYYSRFHQGLFTTICYSILYFAAQNYLDTKSVQKIIKISVATAFLVSLYAILQRFGIDQKLWIQDVVNRPFSTLGQPNWLAAYLLPNLFLTLYLLSKKPKSFFVYTTFTVLLTAMLLTKSRSGFIAFILSYASYYYLLIRQFDFNSIKKVFLHILLLTLAVILIIGTPYTSPLTSYFIDPKSNISPLPTTGTQLENGGTESGDIRKIVWTGALNLIKKHPFLGTGPETFAYTYYWERPLAHNYVSEWDFLYNKAHNEYLNIAATTGLIGLFAYLYFYYAITKTTLIIIPKSKKTNQSSSDHLRYFYPTLGASLVAFSVTNFFGFSVIPVYYLMVLIAALAQSPLTTNSPSPARSIYYYYPLAFIILLYPTSIFIADYNYMRGKQYLDQNSPAQALPYLTKASTARPGQEIYHGALGEAYALLSQPDQAIKEANLTYKQNPYNLNLYKSRAKIYLTLASLDSTYYDLAKNELELASTLAPTDPKLSYNLGLVYTRLGDNDLATKQFLNSISLKNNYESPYYALTLLYEQTNQKDLIPDLLQNAKEHLATYSGALKEKIDSY